MIQIDEYDTPWEVACKLINATYITTVFSKELEREMFPNEDILAIAHHLEHYARTEMELEKMRMSEEVLIR